MFFFYFLWSLLPYAQEVLSMAYSYGGMQFYNGWDFLDSQSVYLGNLINFTAFYHSSYAYLKSSRHGIKKMKAINKRWWKLIIVLCLTLQRTGGPRARAWRDRLQAQRMLLPQSRPSRSISHERKYIS